MTENDSNECGKETENSAALKDAVDRIRDMEALFDYASEKWEASPDDARKDPAWCAAVERLCRYYSHGQWQNDYTLDEQRLLSPTLKRGVLSQDGLYDFLCAVNPWKQK